jgi:single-stranded-DNA-specific exonuclease
MQSVREQARNQSDNPVILVTGDNWHEGIIGLVAGKLAEEIDKPVLVLSNDRQKQLSRGSARSRKGFNIIEALRGFSTHLERYGGHAQAAGFTIRSEHITDLHTHLISWHTNGGEIINEIITEEQDPTGVVTESDSILIQPSQMIDLIFTKHDLVNSETYQEIRKLSPFGAENPEPIFKMEGLSIVSSTSARPPKKHVRLRLESVRDKRIFQGTLLHGEHLLSTLKRGRIVNIIFRLDVFNNDVRQDVWLTILDIEPAQKRFSSP